jgi:hypothetical protein
MTIVRYGFAILAISLVLGISFGAVTATSFERSAAAVIHGKACHDHHAG